VIYARCCRLLGDRAVAENATQETFMRVHKHLDKAPDGREALAWIYRIATNYCLNEIRDRKRCAEPVEELPERVDASVEAVLADR
jgi:RNA polymerase sigma-70 factor (ECF subfamily)